ncbi:pepsin/retropepsin-like aspartic protease family protein [Algoriphagus terrigena]|uniref:pepsin/retropepsin-like aspartic protease family protein n=1 Tax=Algoriphagus terrigena TaxID=344884 RepID=UPI0004066A65|nr:pepsin/retropepsin-like aspartic protease family protein [Algoriphagus terrigena]
MKALLFSIALGVMLPFLSPKNAPVTSVSFQLIRNLILVKGSVDGREGLFILDTGASDMILNSRIFKGKPTEKKFYGIHGNEIENEIKYIEFNLEGFEKNIVAHVADFTALEKITGLQLFGVIGNSLFKYCEIVLDYTFKEVTIYQLDKDGNRLSSKSIHQKPQATIPTFVGRGFPIIIVDANGKQLKMILDTGASANVMDSRQINHLNSDLLRARADSITSFGQDLVPVKSLKVNELKIGDLPCPSMKTLFVPLNQLNKNQWGISVDGILGYEFLSNFRVAINFRKREIYLWDRESVELQWAVANKNLRNNKVNRPNWEGDLNRFDN